MPQNLTKSAFADIISIEYFYSAIMNVMKDIEAFKPSEVLKEEIQDLAALKQEILAWKEKETADETPDFDTTTGQIIDEFTANEDSRKEVMNSFLWIAKEYLAEEWHDNWPEKYAKKLAQIASNLLWEKSFAYMAPEHKATILWTLFFDQIKPMIAKNETAIKEYKANTLDPVLVDIGNQILTNIKGIEYDPTQRARYEDMLSKLKAKRTWAQMK